MTDDARADRRVAHIYFSPFRQESRVARAAETGLEARLFDEVVFYGYREPELAADEILNTGWVVRRLPMRVWPRLPRMVGRLLQFLEWNVRIFAVVGKDRPLLIHCHGLAALPASVLLKWRIGQPLLYDAHELESERNGWPRIACRGAKLLERALVPLVDYTVVVSRSIESWYRHAYGLERLSTVRNMAPARPYGRGTERTSLRTGLGLGAGERLFVYVGLIGEGRGVELTLEAFARAGPHNHLIFLGSGPLETLVHARAAVLPNVHHHEPVPYGEVCTLIAAADVGLVVIEPGCRSHDYCLPNKLFECITAGLPVLCSRLIELEQFVETYRCGWLIEPQAEAMVTFVAGLREDDLLAARDRVAAVRDELTWEVEQEQLPAVYRDLLGVISPSRTDHCLTAAEA